MNTERLQYAKIDFHSQVLFTFEIVQSAACPRGRQECTLFNLETPDKSQSVWSNTDGQIKIISIRQDGLGTESLGLYLTKEHILLLLQRGLFKLDFGEVYKEIHNTCTGMAFYEPVRRIKMFILHFVDVTLVNMLSFIFYLY